MAQEIETYCSSIASNLGTLWTMNRLDSDTLDDDQVLTPGSSYCQIRHSYAGEDKNNDMSKTRYRYEVVLRVIHKLSGPERSHTEALMVLHQYTFGDDNWFKFSQGSSSTRSPNFYDVTDLEISEPEREGDVVWFEVTAMVRFNSLTNLE